MPDVKMSPSKTVLPMKPEIKSSPITPKGEFFRDYVNVSFPDSISSVKAFALT